MEDANALALHAKRVTLMVPDLKLARYLRGDQGTPCQHMPKFVAKGKLDMPGDLQANKYHRASELEAFYRDLKTWPEQTKQLYRALNNKETKGNELHGLREKNKNIIAKHTKVLEWIAIEEAKAHPSPSTCHIIS